MDNMKNAEFVLIQIVQWRVMKEKIVMPHDIMEKLSSTVDDINGTVILQNWRPVQPTNETVWFKVGL